MTAPTLAVITGGPGTGKTTLARELSLRLGCPAILRDEIKQGLAASTPGFRGGGTDPLNRPTLDAFFGVLRVLLEQRVTVIAEAAYQDRLWRPNLEPLADLADIRVVRCTTDHGVARDRIAHRADTDPHRFAHADGDLLRALAAGERSLDSYVPISLDVPTLVVDTTNRREPGLDEIETFLRNAGTQLRP